MNESLSTPRLSGSTHHIGTTSKDQLLSSSPGFSTPAYPIASRPAQRIPPSFVSASDSARSQAILPIVLPPQTLRPIAFRTLTKKHNLTLTSAGLGSLAQFCGKFCGSGWREEGLAELLLDEVGKEWKRDNGGVIVDDGVDKKLRTLLQALESCMFSGRLDVSKLQRSNSATSGLPRRFMDDGRPEVRREDSQGSLGISDLAVEDESELAEGGWSQQNARRYMKIIDAFQQPKLTFSISKKMLELEPSARSILPPIQHRITMFRLRYHLVHQRLMRNESFQTPSFSTANKAPQLLSANSQVTVQQAYTITPISNLLGRSGSSHLLLGLLVHNPAGDIALTDLTGSVVLDMSLARSVPANGAWFCPGMILLAEGTYEEDGSNNSNLGSAGGVGGQIKGQFLVDTMAGPPAERREMTLGIAGEVKAERLHSSGAGFGWIDFLGVGSEKASGARMRHIRKKVLVNDGTDSDERKRTKIAIVSECNLDSPRTIEAIRAMISSYVSTEHEADQPLAVVFMGNFVSTACMAGSSPGGGSIDYKEKFDHLATVLSEFPALLSTTTLIFIPGDKDPWASSFSAGAATLIPRQRIPDLFTSRLRRAVNTANADNPKFSANVPGEIIFTSNPARLSFFGPADEIVLFRDDLSSRLRRHAVMFSSGSVGGEETSDGQALNAEIDEADGEDNLDRTILTAASHLPRVSERIMPSASVATARKMVKTILDQSHLSPFPLSIRPALWDHAASLSLYPLPTALILADAEAPPFAISYEGCHVMNPGCILDDLGSRKGIAKWIEYDIALQRGITRDVRF